MATFFYPDFSLKKKYKHEPNKKSNKQCEKSFEECLLSINNRYDQENMKNRNKKEK
ncbi:hypothetical protein R9X47_26505 [Wukongibacter baidiensis]|uniref:hypothetical protein n=1 Tax=Wukongibacter baidiensis TaxID=1723361 RepID=UPI003D7FFC68